MTGPGASRGLLARLRSELARAGDAGKAAGMRAYMKSKMPYHGVPTPRMRRICREIFAEIDLPTASDWRSATLSVWRRAHYREERYGALELTGLRRYERYQTLDALPMYEEMIVTGGWWDYVDLIATRRLGPLLRNCPAAMRRRMLAWSRCDNLWKRRSSILCQITFKADTDLDLLYACIEPNLSSSEFFLRKAIGWALRQHAWTDPNEVRRYVRKKEKRLSPLSRREALKNV